MKDSLGYELKKIRKEKKMTLQELSDKSGLSISFLSQIERGLRTLTFTSLRKVSEALDVNINFFFEESVTSIKKEGSKNKKKSKTFTYTSLAGQIEKPDFIPALIELKAGEAHSAPYTHSGQEFVYVLSGQLEIELEGARETLYANESIHIDSSKAHQWYNNTNQLTVILLVSSNEK